MKHCKRHPQPRCEGATREKQAGIRTRVFVAAVTHAIVIGFVTIPQSIAQTGPTDVPAHAHLRQFGNDWECDRGYLQEGDTCVAIVVPKNAYLDSSVGAGPAIEDFDRKVRRA